MIWLHSLIWNAHCYKTEQLFIIHYFHCGFFQAERVVRMAYSSTILQKQGLTGFSLGHTPDNTTHNTFMPPLI